MNCVEVRAADGGEWTNVQIIGWGDSEEQLLALMKPFDDLLRSGPAPLVNRADLSVESDRDFDTGKVKVRGYSRFGRKFQFDAAEAGLVYPIQECVEVAP
jgi:hypothetical protein